MSDLFTDNHAHLLWASQAILPEKHANTMHWPDEAEA